MKKKYTEKINFEIGIFITKIYIPKRRTSLLEIFNNQFSKIKLFIYFYFLKKNTFLYNSKITLMQKIFPVVENFSYFLFLGSIRTLSGLFYRQKNDVRNLSKIHASEPFGQEFLVFGHV